MIPKHILEAGCKACLENGIPLMSNDVNLILEAGFKALAEKLIMPTEEQINRMARILHWGWDSNWRDHVQGWLREWQCHMLDDPEPKVPAEIKDLADRYINRSDCAWGDILEAFHRGQLKGKS